MKRIFVLLMLAYSIGFTNANPIIAPPVISEFYLVNASHWYLELVFLKNAYPAPASTLDGYKITTSSGTFIFKNGIDIIPDSIIVITQDSLQTPLQINRMGDFIDIEDATGYGIDYIYFGTISGSQISAPKQGQSIVNYGYSCWNTSLSKPDRIYMKVKDNHPTIGFNPFTPYLSTSPSTTGTFTGIVYDKAHNIVSGIHIGNYYYSVPTSVCGNFFKSTLSDSSGKFSIPEYSGRYYVQLFFEYSRILSYSYVDIEPDSLNYFEFTIDSLLTNVNLNSVKKNINLSCFPNPSTGETTISFDMSVGGHYTSSLIKIYNVNGEMVRILPVSIGNSQKKYSVKWDGLCSDNSTASGLYFCNLELDGRKIASTKIVIEK